MIDSFAPVYVPFTPTGARPTGADRLGLGQVAMQPETSRALNAPDEADAKQPFDPRRTVDQDVPPPQPTPSNVLAAQARFAAASGEFIAEADIEPITSVL